MSDERDPKEPKGAEPAQMSEEALRAQLKRARAAAVASESTPDAGGASGGGGGDDDHGDGGDGERGGDDEGAAVSLDELDLRDALRGALRPPTGAVAPKLLHSVQRKIRIRSRGKFYGDGWSTAEKPRSTYLITSILMLVVIALVFLALIPWSVANLR